MKAQTYKSSPRRRTIRLSKQSNALEAIGTLEPGCELFILTFGQFSLIDALCTVLEQTGPAHVTLATWTAADADLRQSAELLRTARISSMRFLVDRSFLTRHPSYCGTMRELFGDQCIRTARTHAKWALINNDRWKIVFRTSMNLNSNPRLENLEISDDPALFDFLLSIADGIFTEQPVGLFNADLPKLASLPEVQHVAPVAAKPLQKALSSASTGPR